MSHGASNCTVLLRPGLSLDVSVAFLRSKVVDRGTVRDGISYVKEYKKPLSTGACSLSPPALSFHIFSALYLLLQSYLLMRFYILFVALVGIAVADINLKPARRHDFLSRRSSELFLTNNVELTYAQGMATVPNGVFICFLQPLTFMKT